ncbi:MAG: peptide-binding protein [Deltaproteobacteria bacterium]|nr:peptide-binding protein [Deltaproteobacteria bacterium]
MNIRYRIARLVLPALVVLIFLSCGQKEEASEPSVQNPATQESSPPEPAKAVGEPAYGDALVEGSIGDASNLIPMLSSDSSSHAIAGLVYNGLVKYDKDINLVGDLAEKWNISEDGTVIDFHLRKGVKWHDGSPFTAEDALFTYKVMIDPKTPTAYADDFLQVQKAELIDSYTMRVTYKRPFAPALASWGMGVAPKHLLEGKDITQSPLVRDPVGTGPYLFERWITGREIVLRANPNYFEGRPYISESKTRIIPDSATMFLELEAGGIDLMGLTPIQYTRQTVSDQWKKRFNKYSYLASAYTYLGYNLEDSKFKDKRVRQAISYAVNKQELIDGVLLGLGEAASGPFKPGTWPYNPDVKPYAYNPERAKELLREAGWEDTDGDGLLDKDGEPFRFTILTNQGNESRQKTGVIIQFSLKAIGIEVQVRTVEWAAFLKEFIDKKKFEAVILGWTIPPDPDLFDVWHSSKTRPSELNFVSYRNEEVDRLIEKSRYTFDREVRKECLYKIQEILAEDQPYTFLYVPQALVAVSSRIRGIEPAPLGIAYNRIKWYVPADQQKYKIAF